MTAHSDMRFDGRVAVITVPGGPADEMGELFSTIMSPVTAAVVSDPQTAPD